MKFFNLTALALFTIFSTQALAANGPTIISRYIERGKLSENQIAMTMERLNRDAIRAPLCHRDQKVVRVSVRENQNRVIYTVSCKSE